jgi:hypothetical protein
LRRRGVAAGHGSAVRDRLSRDVAVAAEERPDVGLVLKAEAEIDAVTRDRKVKVKVDVDKGTLGPLFGMFSGSLGEFTSAGAEAGTAFTTSAAKSVSAGGPVLMAAAVAALAPHGPAETPPEGWGIEEPAGKPEA